MYICMYICTVSPFIQPSSEPKLKIIIHKLKTRNKLNNLATLNIKPMNKPEGFLGQTTNT